MAKRKTTAKAAASLEAYNVFISWSGERSKKVAEALREWLPTVLQAAKPWMSDSDIEKSSRGLDEVAKALSLKVGIVCLTPENLKAEWINYEAGALAKTLDDKTRVCTYLLFGLRPQDIEMPLGMFQATRADKDDTRKLVYTINKNLDTTVPESVVDAVFDAMWPKLEVKLKALPASAGAVPRPKRSVEEMVAEILELSRAMAPQLGELHEKEARQRFLISAMQNLQNFYKPGATGKMSDLLVPTTGSTEISFDDTISLADKIKLADRIRLADERKARLRDARARQVHEVKSKKESS